MSTIRCDEFLHQVEDWVDGNRHPDGETHVRGCRACQGLVADMAAIRSAARSWESMEPADPPARIWESLRLQLEAEGLIQDFSPVTATEIPVRETWPPRDLEQGPGWLGRLFRGGPRPALAGAYLAALIGVGFALSGPASWHPADDHWNEVTQNTTTPLRFELETVEHGVSTLAISDPIVIASLHKNLAIVDNYIALCEKSVREEPGNEIARDYLYGAYQQKADLLAQMTENGDRR